MARYFVMSLLIAAMLAQLTESKPAYQILESKPGYIPVYIRFGDQPLAEINPFLAEAFQEHGISARNIKSELESTPDSPESSFNLSSMMPSSKAAEGVTKLFPAGNFTPLIPDTPDEVKSSSSDESDKAETTTKKE